MGLRFKDFSFVGFCHGYFSWLGSPLLRLYRGVVNDLQAADLRIHALAYTSLVAFVTVLSIIFSVIGVLLQILGFLLGIPLPLVFLWIALPLLILFIGRVIPKIFAFNRAAALEIEVPYASAYVSVMSTGGLSPYRSLQRLKYVELLPNLAKAAKKMDLEVEVMGVDPLTAIETLARTIPSKE